ncbi:MAG: threonine synthase, partial [Proteobacteria bacterium]|nr:threonine synthase [Pseudomonadota bacterium]
MRYISTRGKAPPLAFDEAMLCGLAPDGGLYIPESWPRFSADDIAGFTGLSYAELAVRIMTPFIGDALAADDFAAMVEAVYGADNGIFAHPEVTPLVPLGENEWLLELFHGPTLAFKDYPLQLVGRLFDHVLGRRGERLTLVGATSGDTG